MDLSSNKVDSPASTKGGVTFGIAVTMLEDAGSLSNFATDWGVEVLSQLLHRSAEICLIEPSKKEKSMELQEILKAAAWKHNFERFAVLVYRSK